MRKLSVSMTKAETVTGCIYIIFQLFALPFIVLLADAFFRWNLTLAELNFICFAVNFTALTAIYRRYLLDSWKVFTRQPKEVFRSCGLGFVIHFAGSFLVSYLIVNLDPEFNNVNDNSIGEMIHERAVLMYLGTILLAPVAEEILFRGVVFGSLYRKWPVLAYILSAAIFSALHVISYIGSYPAWKLLLCFLQYIPASVALAYAYVRADTIFAPILMHIAINALGTSVMG